MAAPSPLASDVAFPAGRFVAEYVWLDGRYGLRSKARTLPMPETGEPLSHAVSEVLPEWNYDGSSTDQARGSESEIVLRPKTMFRCPFRGARNLLVLCDTYAPDGKPLESNTRFQCASVMRKASDLEPWFGIEQEYFIMRPEDELPVGFPTDGSEPEPQFRYYCGVGAGSVAGRQISDEHYKACLHAGVRVSGTNAEVALGQWEFQVGPCVGIEAGDHLWMARYILVRIAEAHGYRIELHPKPLAGHWNGSGAHVNFSTKAMREGDGALDEIYTAIERLSHKHEKHIAAYGVGNDKRLTGRNETGSIEEFTWGKGNRGASCRIGNHVLRDGRGYFEDRRPASNMDPYVVTRMLVGTCCSDARRRIE